MNFRRTLAIAPRFLALGLAVCAAVIFQAFQG
jgi:hypothetical protein